MGIFSIFVSGGDRYWYFSFFFLSYGHPIQHPCAEVTIRSGMDVAVLVLLYAGMCPLSCCAVKPGGGDASLFLFFFLSEKQLKTI